MHACGLFVSCFCMMHVLTHAACVGAVMRYMRGSSRDVGGLQKGQCTGHAEFRNKLIFLLCRRRTGHNRQYHDWRWCICAKMIVQYLEVFSSSVYYIVRFSILIWNSASMHQMLTVHCSQDQIPQCWCQCCSVLLIILSRGILQFSVRQCVAYSAVSVAVCGAFKIHWTGHTSWLVWDHVYSCYSCLQWLLQLWAVIVIAVCISPAPIGFFSMYHWAAAWPCLAHL